MEQKVKKGQGEQRVWNGLLSDTTDDVILRRQ